MVTAVDSGVVKIWKEGNSSENKIVTGTHLEKMRCKASPGGGVTIATSGKENDLKLWDLATMKQTFNAKNVSLHSILVVFLRYVVLVNIHCNLPKR